MAAIGIYQQLYQLPPDMLRTYWATEHLKSPLAAPVMRLEWALQCGGIQGWRLTSELVRLPPSPNYSEDLSRSLWQSWPHTDLIWPHHHLPGPHKAVSGVAISLEEVNESHLNSPQDTVSKGPWIIAIIHVTEGRWKHSTDDRCGLLCYKALKTD